jgi:pimeloyl-ACP methyl ester carboxylesterase
MSSFVLVPGAWIGAWAWKTVTDILWSRGHDVYPVTLTGLAERSHLARPEIDLEVHIRDVQSLIAFNELTDVVLVGHSYAGAVVRGVADRVASQIAHLVYVDTAPPGNLQSLIDFFPPELTQAMRDGVKNQGDGWKLPAPTAATLGNIASTEGMSHDDLTHFERLATDQPFATYTQPLRLTGTSESFYKRTLIQCNDARAVREWIASSDTPDPYGGDWQVFDLAGGHWPMISEPKALASILNQLARSS